MSADLTIDPEFKALIPPLSSDEYSQLESNLKAEGCRDPIVTWQGIIIDGHNRFEICTANGIGFEKIIKQFADRSEVIEWIIRNQFGRRNLDGYQRTKLALRLEEMIAARAKAKQDRERKSGGALSQKSAESPIETREEIAKLAGVSRDTVDKVKAIERKATPEIKEALSKGEISINKAHQSVKAPREEPEPLVVDGTRNKPSRPIIGFAPGKEPKRLRNEAFIQGLGVQIASTAMIVMDRIAHDDSLREQGLRDMIAYCENRISSKK